MTWYPDLARCDYFGAEVADCLKAVGWLSRDREYSTGKTSVQVFEKLCQLLQNPWNPAYTAGIHMCEFCAFTGGGKSGFKEYLVSGVSKCCLFVPGDGFLYVAPESITHYIDAHGYLPPEEFQLAVLSCPPMRSMDYLKAILSNGGRGLR